MQQIHNATERSWQQIDMSSPAAHVDFEYIEKLADQIDFNGDVSDILAKNEEYHGALFDGMLIREKLCAESRITSLETEFAYTSNNLEKMFVERDRHPEHIIEKQEVPFNSNVLKKQNLFLAVSTVAVLATLIAADITFLPTILEASGYGDGTSLIIYIFGLLITAVAMVSSIPIMRGYSNPSLPSLVRKAGISLLVHVIALALLYVRPDSLELLPSLVNFLPSSEAELILISSFAGMFFTSVYILTMIGLIKYSLNTLAKIYHQHINESHMGEAIQNPVYRALNAAIDEASSMSARLALDLAEQHSRIDRIKNFRIAILNAASVQLMDVISINKKLIDLHEQKISMLRNKKTSMKSSSPSLQIVN
jgi:hypothetical protein